jgi:hypothetical protein
MFSKRMNGNESPKMISIIVQFQFSGVENIGFNFLIIFDNTVG